MYDSQISFVQEYHHCLLCLCFAPFCLACALLRFAFFCRTGASCERQGRPVLGCQRSHATRLKSTARHVTRLDFTGRRPAKSDWLSPACAIGKTYRFPLDREERDSIDNAYSSVRLIHSSTVWSARLRFRLTALLTALRGCSPAILRILRLRKEGTP